VKKARRNEGSHHGMEEYVEIKYVMMAGV